MFSIVVPIYNSEKYLQETLESVLAQTFSEWELLLVDDGSTDLSADICKSFVAKDNRIQFFQKKNGGQASARNLGITKAKFEWIAFLDSDDVWVIDKLEKQHLELNKHKCDFLYSSGYEMHDNEIIEYDWVFEDFKELQFFRLLYTSSAVNCNTVIVKKELIVEVGYFDENPILRGVEDWDLWLRLAKKAKKIFGSKERLAYYRIHGGGIHHQMARMFTGKRYVYQKYDNDKTVPRLVRLRQYRYTYRELINHLYDEKRSDEIKSRMAEFRKYDKYSWAALLQVLLVRIFSYKSFLWISNKIIYRVAYRLEAITYKLFISRDFK